MDWLNSTNTRPHLSVSLFIGLLLVAAHARPTGAQAVANAEENPHPKSIQVPGTGTYLTFGGFIKFDIIRDLDPIGNAFDFKANTIPIEETAASELGGRMGMSARETRFSLDVHSGIGHDKVRAYLEADFQGDGNSLKLRHAWGTWGRFLAGQTWTTFMDFAARPQTLDTGGLEGEIYLRQALLRWTQPVADDWKWIVAVENPSPELSIAPGLTGSARSTLPDLATNLSFDAGKTHFQAGGVLRQVRYEGGATDVDAGDMAWGISGSFRIPVAKPLDVMGQVYTGEGIGHYVASLEGQASDAFVDASGLTTLPVSGLVAGLEQRWGRSIRSGCSYSQATVDNEPRQPETAIRKAEDIRVSSIWTAAPPVDLGLEVLWGRIEHHDGGTGEAVRIMLSTIIRLN